MASLYSKCLAEDNIRQAIKTVLSHEGSKTPGPDGINKDNIGNNVIKEIKLRLRRYKKVSSKQVQIPKKSGKTRTLTVCNLYDRIAQQAVYQIIEPIVDTKMSKNSYGFRKGLQAKMAVAKVANVFHASKHNYTIELDFKSCFDNIPLEKAIGELAKLGVKDPKLLATIKHLMYISREYKGIGLGQGTILGPILANCFLNKLDLWIEENMDLGVITHRKRDFELHKENYTEWLKSRGRKPQGKYLRYADDTLIIVHSRNEQLAVSEAVSRFIEKELKIGINQEKSKLGYNTVNFLGFTIKKNIREKEYIGLYIDEANEKEIKEVVKSHNFVSFEEVWRFKKWLVGILNYYDIANNIGSILRYITKRLLNRARKIGNLQREEGTTKYTWTHKERSIVLDIYEIRKNTKLSYKEYIYESKWLNTRELLQVWEYSDSKLWHIYAYPLFTKQRGKDPITGKDLKLGDIDIHHIKPRRQQGQNALDNLIMVSTATHKLIHNSEETQSKKLQWYRKQLDRKY